MNVNELEHECMKHIGRILLANVLEFAQRTSINKVNPVIDTMEPKLTTHECFELREAAEEATEEAAQKAYLMGMIDLMNLTKGARINYDFDN